MGLLKRLFSLGSKKSKKQRPPIVHNTPIPEQPWSEVRPVEDDEHEAAVSRLLRSSSARFVEAAELDYATLPPLPHPINKVIHTPASSTISLASTSLNQRGTYNVTVHKRKRHASTEFPYANRDLNYSEESPSKQKRSSLLPTEDSRVLRLRSDPSVASLIDLYDEHGKLSADVFSNSPPSPPREGRAQVHRNGSTLRQLLGAPSSLNSRNSNNSGSVEGDISWAERFLAETETASSSSSLDLWAPKTPQFYTEALQPEVSFGEGDISTSTFDNPAISSMEVELSIVTNFSGIDMDDLEKVNSPYQNSDPSTPQRASQIFGFLTRSKQSKAPEDLDRALPELPSCFSSPSDENGTHADFEAPASNAAPKFFSVTAPMTDATPKHSRPRSDITEKDHLPDDGEEFPCLHSAFSDDSHHSFTARPVHHLVRDSQTIAMQGADEQETKQNDIKVIMTGPTRVIVTAPTPSTNREGAIGLPRGPRAHPRKSLSGSVKRRRSALVELSNSSSNPHPISDPFTSIPPRRKPRTHHRSSSQTSVASLTRSEQQDYAPKNVKADIIPPSGGQKKENQLSLSVRNEIPSTPLRSNTTGSRSLLRSVVEHAMFRPPVGMTPSPASSSEMSPVGRQIMMDVRQQRMKAREADRERTGKVSSERRGQRI